jgi:hypothetical protein
LTPVIPQPSDPGTSSAAVVHHKPSTVTIVKLDSPMRREQQQWYDVGIIKGTSCLVTHFFLPSDMPLEDQFGVSNDGV